MSASYINAIATAVPQHEVHSHFDNYARQMIHDPRRRALVERMIARSGIERRYSVLEPRAADIDPSQLDAAGMFRLGNFPTTGERMVVYDREACDLAESAARQLDGDALERTTHLIVTSCTGFAAPGVDLQLLSRLGLPLTTERTVIGFMGCYAAINALRLAAAIVGADRNARVLCVSVELCTLHLQETQDLETLLSFMIFGDGAAAALVSAEPSGLSLDGFRTALMPAADDLITWHIGDNGFDMRLSGEVPKALSDALPGAVDQITHGKSNALDLWAIHPGGRSVLDAAERALALPQRALEASRRVLADYGNMSSPSVLFVLAQMLRGELPSGERGVALAFGPGLTAEGMLFSTA